MHYSRYFSLFLAFCCFSKAITAQHISDFVSPTPGDQIEALRLPSTHTFQYLVSTGDTLPAGDMFPAKPDFTGYFPRNGSSKVGKLAINSESDVGEVTIIDLHFDSIQYKWVLDSSGKVDFASVEGTRNNCSGGITPWGTLLSCEEKKTTGSTNSMGYLKFGYCIEVDVNTKKVLNYPGGLPDGDKVWKMAHGNHENACVHANQRTLYTGMDDSSGYLYKYVTDVPANLSDGKLYVLAKTSPNTGQWKRIQNTTIEDVNTTIPQSYAVGGEGFMGIEDVEIGPDGMVYFAVKDDSSVYRFIDHDYLCETDSLISNFEKYVGGVDRSYPIETDTAGIVMTAWGKGNDNLAFDNLGNLWIFQDGTEYSMWVVAPTHTQANPNVKYFGSAPLSSEPTGITFTPDYRYLFMSFQEPSSSNDANQLDAFSIARDHNKSTTIVVARKEFLGNGVSLAMHHENYQPKDLLFPNPLRDGLLQVQLEGEYFKEVEVCITNAYGLVVKKEKLHDITGGRFVVHAENLSSGMYFLHIKRNGQFVSVGKFLVEN